MDIVQVYRRPREDQFSIERVFQTLNTELDKTWEIKRVECPRITSGIGSVLENLRFFSRQKGELFHITGDVFYIGCVLPRKKFFITIHDLGALKEAKGLRKLLLLWFWFIIPISRSARIVTISEATYSDILAYFPWAKNKVVIIPNAIFPMFKPLDGPNPKSEDPPKILIVGTRVHKNIDAALTALKGVNCEVWIVGNPSDSQQQIIEEAGWVCKQYKGLTTEALVSLYQHATCLLFPSLHEGFGLPILEAQSCGTVVITSNLSPMKEVSGEGAILVDPGSIPEIRNAVLRMISEKETRKRLIEKGFENVSRFQLPAVAAQYSAIISQLIKERQTHES